MLTISSEHALQRIDNFLMTVLKGVPRSRIYRAIRQGEVRVNKGRVNAMYKLNEGDVVRIPPIRTATRTELPASSRLQLQLQQAIIFQHDDFLILNKPHGLAVHGGSSVQTGVIEALKQLQPETDNYYLIHRLDRDTSGCLLIAKNRQAMLFLQEKIRLRAIEKEYELLVHGRWPSHVKSVNKPLLQTLFGDEKRVIVDPTGKAAQTEFEVVQNFGNTTLLRARLLTGRMHQIRVHAQSVGCPIVGDRKYGNRDLDKKLAAHFSVTRLFLHAQKLAFHYKDSAFISVTAQGFSVNGLSPKH